MDFVEISWRVGNGPRNDLVLVAIRITVWIQDSWIWIPKKKMQTDFDEISGRWHKGQGLDMDHNPDPGFQMRITIQIWKFLPPCLGGGMNSTACSVVNEYVLHTVMQKNHLFCN